MCHNPEIITLLYVRVCPNEATVIKVNELVISKNFVFPSAFKDNSEMTREGMQRFMGNIHIYIYIFFSSTVDVRAAHTFNLSMV